MHTCKTPSTPDAPQCHASCEEAEHEPRHRSRRLNLHPRRAVKVPRSNRPARRSATVTNKTTLGFARKEPHDCGLLRPAGAGSRDLLAMTSHNGCTKQRRLILPLSASGVLRQGRCPALRCGAICCIELCDVMPSPEAGGRSRARPQYIPRCGRFTNPPDRRIVSACFPFLPASRHHAAVPRILAAP